MSVREPNRGKAIEPQTAHRPLVTLRQSPRPDLPVSTTDDCALPSESLRQSVGGISGRWRATTPFCLIALLLLASAGTKLWMLLTEPFADVRVGLPKEILWLTRNARILAGVCKPSL